MNKFVLSLSNTLNRISKEKTISRNEFVKVLLDIRQLIESGRLESQFKLTNLFLNWCFHPQISKSKIAYIFLHDLSLECLSALKKHVTIEDDKDATRLFIEVTENILNFPKFRKELIELFDKYSLQTVLFKIKSNWDAFSKIVIEEIFEKPLTFPEKVLSANSETEISKRYKQAYELLDKIKKLDPKKRWAQIIGIRIIKGSTGFTNLYCIELTTLTKVKYVMQLKGKEPIDNFK